MPTGKGTGWQLTGLVDKGGFLISIRPKAGLRDASILFWGQQGLHLKRVKEDILHKYPKATKASSH